MGPNLSFQKHVYRICQLNKKRGGKFTSKIIMSLGQLIWPCDIDENAIIGHIVTPHAIGIVIGATAIIEDDVTIFSNVVIGANQRGKIINGRSHAHIKRGVIIGANSSIIGPITIGEYSTIGAGAVITKDVPAYSTVVGINHRINKK